MRQPVFEDLGAKYWEYSDEQNGLCALAELTAQGEKQTDDDS